MNDIVDDATVANLNTSKPWREEHDRAIRMSVERGRTIADIAHLLDRTEAELRRRIEELGLAEPNPPN